MSEKVRRQKIGIYIKEENYKRGKLASVLREEDFQVIVDRALEEWLDRNNIPYPNTDQKPGE